MQEHTIGFIVGFGIAGTWAWIFYCTSRIGQLQKEIDKLKQRKE